MTDPPAASAPYRVLARKYRPTRFADLIGQEALVRTLTNAIQSGRIAHAYMLTGVRGVGKTTTARILARALDCVGVDGAGGPTIEPCGVCLNCTAIAEDRHVDVMEMDAASRTGVNDIRELIEGVRYLPVQARFKIYIIDEVHMLSGNAFNALLKTLEEPPAHVKFVFATTEIRKVPVTVLSRCQRFDLRRIEAERLAAHFAGICTAEDVAADDEALALIARAADGSVRDGLSLLDQAIALGDGRVEAGRVREMLGLADRGQVFDLFEAVMRGATREALALFDAAYAAGADPLVVLQDLLGVVHGLARAKAVAGTEAAIDAAQALPELDRVRGGAMALTLTVPVLTRAWQILLKGLGEVQAAPAARLAAEMVLIRLAHVADLPDPAAVLRGLAEGGTASAGAGGSGTGGSGAGMGGAGGGGGGSGRSALRGMSGEGVQAARAQPVSHQATPIHADAIAADAPPDPRSWAEAVRLFADNREAILHAQLERSVHLVSFEPGHIEIRPEADAPRDLANRMGSLLSGWTGRRWVISVSDAEGEPTLRLQRVLREEGERHEAARHPLVQAVLQAFPGATIEAVRALAAPGMAPGGVMPGSLMTGGLMTGGLAAAAAADDMDGTAIDDEGEGDRDE